VSSILGVTLCGLPVFCPCPFSCLILPRRTTVVHVARHQRQSERLHTFRQTISGTNIASAPVDPIRTRSSIHRRTTRCTGFWFRFYDGSTSEFLYRRSGTPCDITYTPTARDDRAMPVRGCSIEGYPIWRWRPAVLVLDSDNCWLYELWVRITRADLAAGSAPLGLLNDEQRPIPGRQPMRRLSVFAGLARYEKLPPRDPARLALHTANVSRVYSSASHWPQLDQCYAAPWACVTCSELRHSIPRSRDSHRAATIRMIMADNGSSMFITAPERWMDTTTSPR